MSLSLLDLWVSTAKPKPDITKFFASDTFLGTGTPGQTLTDGIDRTDGKPVLDIFCSLTASQPAIWCTTLRGAGKHLVGNSINAEVTDATGVTAYLSDGLSVGGLAGINQVSQKIAHYTFKEQDKFFTMRTVAHVNGVADNVDLSMLGTVGAVVVKLIDGVSAWPMYHRAGNTVNAKYQLNNSNAPSNDTSIYAMTLNTLTLVSSAATGTYLICAWAHDPSADGLIYSDSVASTGVVQDVTIGWESQFVLHTKQTGGGQRYITDHLLGLYGIVGYCKAINDAVSFTNQSMFSNRARNGLQIPVALQPFLFMAVRRPTEDIVSGTQVFAPVAQAGNSTIDVGFTPDAVLRGVRTSTGAGSFLMTEYRYSRFEKPVDAAGVVSTMPGSTGFRARTGILTAPPNSAANMIYWLLKDAPGFLAQEVYIGTSSAGAVLHNLGVPPEMVWVASVNIDAGASGNESSYTVRGPGMSNNESLLTHSTAAKSSLRDFWGGGAIGDSATFNVGGGDAYTNLSGETYMALLFASKPGISKCTSYVGNGTSQTINCGFSNGARGVLIKAVDAVGRWWIFDTVRGIVAGNDVAQSFGQVENTSLDPIDPDPSGFIVNQYSTTNLNVSGVTYMVWAIA